MSAQEKNLRRWIENNLNSSRKLGTLEKIQVRHVQTGNRVGDEVSFYEVGEEPSDTFAEDVTREILETLTNEVENLGGVQKFACFAYFTKSDEPVNRHVVRMRSETAADNDERSLDTEAPNNSGLVSASQRHTEAAFRLLIMGMSSQTAVQAKMIDKLGNMVEALMADKLENMQIVNKLLDRKLERDLALESEKTKQEAVRAGFESIKLLAPTIVNKLAKRKLLPEANSPIAKLGHQFFKAIAAKPDKMSTIIGALDPNERIALMELVEAFESESEDDQKVKAAAS